ncbi:unnamed protein product [Penicillium roqueforti FM164]|jgi:hypothetical protein|uniref:Genomic scaffold, ProqFM164S02 n=1 Tax=Penicillium roqueforti (strain FM164) TaxID=1365484 RepID=W6Q8X1_PENRF|nr:unnamed protein product [Penicillium roqueforti FM164]
MLPPWVQVYCSIFVQCIVHFRHQKRKCSTVSLACPHTQDEEVRQTSIISTDIGNGGMAVKEHEAGNVFASVSASEGLNDFGKS